MAGGDIYFGINLVRLNKLWNHCIYFLHQFKFFKLYKLMFMIKKKIILTLNFEQLKLITDNKLVQTNLSSTMWNLELQS